MKAKCIFTVIGFVALMACKKEKVEPITEIKKSDTTVTIPPYWCVKSAILKRFQFPDRHVQFEYNSKSQVISVKEYSVSTPISSFTEDSIITRYNYNGDKIVYMKMKKSTGAKLEEFITYENDKIKKKEVTSSLSYYFESKTPSVTVYEYVGNTISTTTSYPYYENVNGNNEILTGTVTTTFKDYPDSSVVETNHIQALQYIKEKLYKRSRKIIVYEPKSRWVTADPSSIINNSDSINLSQKENRFNPIVWDYLKIHRNYFVESNYQIYPVLLNKNYNNFIIDSREVIDSKGVKENRTYNYQYDSEDRVINIKVLNGEDEITLTY